MADFQHKNLVLVANTSKLALNIVKTGSDLESIIANLRQNGKTIGFVPTMGALHQGHLHLIEEAAKVCDSVVCSIFVNPTQFNDKSDFDRYPRTLESDVSLLEKTSCAILFAPSVEEMYPNGKQILKIDLKGVDLPMEGLHRPGHFDGVVTVVHRLFELVKPDKALFGLKDYQQYCLIKQLQQHAFKSIEIIGVETVREASGLAMSSRNRLLEPELYELAPVIYTCLCEAKENYGKMPVNNIKFLIEQRLSAIPDVKIDYVEIADAELLQPITNYNSNTKARIFIAAFFGKIRLIDNIALN